MNWKNCSFFLFLFSLLAVSVWVLLSSTGFSFSPVTGVSVADVATTSFRVEGIVSLTLTNDSAIDFPSGRVDGETYSILNSYNSSKNTNFILMNSELVKQSYHRLLNVGTSSLKVTAQSDMASASEFLCGTGCQVSNGETALVQLKIADVEAGSCALGAVGNWSDLLNNSDAFDLVLCEHFAYYDPSDSIDVYVRVRIPYDVGVGQKNMTITYIGEAV